MTRYRPRRAAAVQAMEWTGDRHKLLAWLHEHVSRRAAIETPAPDAYPPGYSPAPVLRILGVQSVHLRYGVMVVASFLPSGQWGVELMERPDFDRLYEEAQD